MTTPYTAVARIMSWPVATIDHEATVQDAAEALAADNVGIVLVLRDGNLAGLISERDVVAHVAAGADLTHLQAREVMTGDLVTTSPSATIVEASRMMIATDVRHLPVLQDRLIAGVLSMRDVVTALVDAAEGDVVVVPSGTKVVVTAT